jgi:hypothetical protein
MAMGGIGEAAMLGAVMGGGSALLTGGDPLKGALMGTLTGGVGGAVSPALSALTAPTAATLAPTIAPAVATETAVAALAPEVAASAATTPGITTLANGLPTDISNKILGQIAPNAATPAAVMPAATAPAQNLIARVPNFESNLIARVPGDIPIQPTSFDSFGSVVPINSPAYSMADPTGLAQQQLNLNTAAPPVDDSFLGGIKKFADNPMSSLMNNKFTAAGSALAGATAARKKKEEEEEYSGPLSRFKYNPDSYRPAGYADGGIANLYSGGYDQMVGEEPMYMSNMAHGGIANLGSYSDGGRMLKGPGDGMSDSIPASISGKRPARLADGEFVVPADVVSHLGNGSTDAGAKQLYAMMNKVRQARTGRKAQGREINPRQYVPA